MSRCLKQSNAKPDKAADATTIHKRTGEHLFGTFKHRTGYTHFLTRRLPSPNDQSAAVSKHVSIET